MWFKCLNVTFTNENIGKFQLHTTNNEGMKEYKSYIRGDAANQVLTAL